LSEFFEGRRGVLERLLRLKDAAPKAPEPLSFKDEWLHFVPPSPQLSAYDALLLDVRHDDEPEPDDEPQPADKSDDRQARASITSRPQKPQA